MSLFHLWNWGRDISLLARNPLTNCKTCMCIDLAVSLPTMFQVVSFHTFVLANRGLYQLVNLSVLSHCMS